MTAGAGAANSWHVPTWVRIPQLEMLLGCRLGDLTWPVLEDLIQRRQISEDLTLDFKRDLYERNDKRKKDLAKDLAAFANAAGGLVIVGVDEDQDGRATELVKVDLSDDERNRMREILSTRVAPFMPDVQVGELHDPSDPGRGVFLLLVPASDAAPHGVRNDDWFLWPVREDRTKRMMHEAELAARYRERLAGAARAQERLEQADTEGVRRLWLDDGWLALTLTPAKPGRRPADRDAYREWLREHFISVPWGLSVDAGALLGRRRVIFTDRFPFPGHSTDHHLELHSDGTGFAAIALATARRPVNADELGLPDTCRFFRTDHVAAWTVGLLNILAHHAVRTGGGGNLSVRAQLLPGQTQLFGPGLPVVPGRGRPMAVSEEFVLDGARFGERTIPGTRRLTTLTPLDAVVPASVVTSPRDLVSAAADIAHELVVEFGAPPPPHSSATMAQSTPRQPPLQAPRRSVAGPPTTT
jgi:hypothetical protein